MNDYVSNPGQDDIDNKTDLLKKAEQKKEINELTTPENVNDLFDSENKDYTNNVTATERFDKKSNITGKSFLKKKGPITALLISLLASGIFMGGLLSPAMLLIHIQNIMVDKFNMQLTSLDIRTNKILTSKTLGNVNCGTIITCKYSSMPDYQVNRLAKSGIEVQFDDTGKTDLLGRKKVKQLIYKDNPISPDEFKVKLAVDPDFRLSVKRAYNPLFAGFADSNWNTTLSKLGVSESAVILDGVTDEEKLADIQDRTTKSSTLDDSLDDIKLDSKEADGSFTYDQDLGIDDPKYIKDLDSLNTLKKTASEITDGAAEVVSTGIKSTTKNLGQLVNVTGIADDTCTIYGTVRAIGFAAKTVRSDQLAAFAMMFFTVASMIQAGDSPEPDTTSKLGTILTTEANVTNFEGVNILDNEGNPIKQTATDSFGVKYATYGELGTMPDSTNQFLAGAGFAGTLVGITSLINNNLGGSPQTVCKTLNNIFIQIGSAAAGIGLAISTGGVSLIGKTGLKILGGISVAVFLSYLPTLLQDIIAGVLIDESTVGGLAGDAITSGAGVLMSKAAAQGGNAPLTVDEAVAYNNKTKEILALYAEEDRTEYSPLDITSKNTFMGMIFSRLTPFIASISSPIKAISSSLSLFSNSISSLSPIAKAADSSEYEICEDPDYTELGLAADPFCNLTYGIPVDYLENIDPVEVVEQLGDNINSNGEIEKGSDLEEFQKNCIDRDKPLGYTGEDYQDEDGSECLVEVGDNKYFYLYLIDQRILNGMDGEDTALEAAYESGIDSNISFYNGDYKSSDNIAENNIITNITNFIKNPFGLILSNNESGL